MSSAFGGGVASEAGGADDAVLDAARGAAASTAASTAAAEGELVLEARRQAEYVRQLKDVDEPHHATISSCAPRCRSSVARRMQHAGGDAEDGAGAGRWALGCASSIATWNSGRTARWAVVSSFEFSFYDYAMLRDAGTCTPSTG